VIEVYEKAGAKHSQMGASTELVWAYIELGEIEKAENLINSLCKFTPGVEDKLLIARVDALRAMLFRAQKKWKESIEYFEKSLQEHEALNARRELKKPTQTWSFIPARLWDHANSSFRDYRRHSEHSKSRRNCYDKPYC
jgi:tetratricopeptide (TPR) repeat protein